MSELNIFPTLTIIYNDRFILQGCYSLYANSRLFVIIHIIHAQVGILKYLQDSPPEAEFTAMFPLHACCNHSCYNNAEVCDIDLNGRPGVQMIACRDIK